MKTLICRSPNYCVQKQIFFPIFYKKSFLQSQALVLIPSKDKTPMRSSQQHDSNSLDKLPGTMNQKKPSVEPKTSDNQSKLQKEEVYENKNLLNDKDSSLHNQLIIEMKKELLFKNYLEEDFKIDSKFQLLRAEMEMKIQNALQQAVELANKQTTATTANMRVELESKILQAKNELDSKIEQIKDDLERNLQQIKGDLERNLQQIKGDLERNSQQINDLEKNLQQIKGDLERNSQQINDLEKNLQQLEWTFKKKLHQLKVEMERQIKRAIDELSQKFEKKIGGAKVQILVEMREMEDRIISTIKNGQIKASQGDKKDVEKNDDRNEPKIDNSELPCLKEEQKVMNPKEKTSSSILMRQHILQKLEQKSSNRMGFDRLIDQSSSRSNRARNPSSRKDKNSGI